jgi:hypothetical protein
VARSATRLGGYERTQSPVGPAEAHSCNFRDIIDFLTMHPDAQSSGRASARGDRRTRRPLLGVVRGAGAAIIAQLVIRILAVLQLPPYAQNVMLAT